MSKREGELKSAFGRVFKSQLPHFIVLFHSTRAAPDRAIIGGGQTTYWEFKCGTPRFETPGDQLLMCRRLAGNGFRCFYVVWRESRNGSNQETLIIHPEKVQDGTLEPEARCSGFNHYWLTDYIRHIHGK